VIAARMFGCEQSRSVVWLPPLPRHGTFAALPDSQRSEWPSDFTPALPPTSVPLVLGDRVAAGGWLAQAEAARTPSTVHRLPMPGA
jgi:hypothetical protein